MSADERYRVLARRQVVIPAEVFVRAPSARAIQVWGVLAFHADFRDTRSYPGHRRLAELCKCSRERVQSAISDLERAGLLSVVQGGPGEPNTYDLRAAWGVAGPPAGVAGPPARTDKERLSPSDKAQISEVEGYWRGLLAPRARTSKARTSKVLARLREGYTPGELKSAVLGCSRSDWHVQNHHTDLSLICRDAAHVDRFMALAGASMAGRQLPPEPGRELSIDERSLNDTMEAIARSDDPDERAELERDAEAIRSRIRQAMCEAPPATQPTQE